MVVMSDIENLPDEEILKQSLRDPSKFKILVDKYQAALLRKALGIVKKTEEAEDIVQDTFVKIYKYAHRFKKEAGIEFKSWAYKILMNTSFTRYQDLKKKWSNVEYLDPVLYEDVPHNGSQDLNPISDAKAAVSVVIDKMPENLARVLKLYYLDDKSYKDICGIENISLTTLKMRLFRAKRVFKKMSAEA